MSDLKEARVLIEAAERDISALRGMHDADVFADEIFGFHVQQAAEKLFKAWLALLGEVYPLTHDLDLLLDLLQKRESDTASFRNLVEFVLYAVQFRYDVDPDPEVLNRVSALQYVEDLLQHVRQRLTETEGK